MAQAVLKSSPQWRDFVASVVSDAGIMDESVEAQVTAAMSAVDLSWFVESVPGGIVVDRSYPVGFNEFSIRPSNVARMLGLLGKVKGKRVLVVGCGGGFTSAVLARLGAFVFGVEHNGLLAQRTRKKLDANGFQNVIIHVGDGLKGWKPHAPYDAIIGGFLMPAEYRELLNQLSPDDGRCIVPVEDQRAARLVVWNRTENRFTKTSFERREWF